MSPVMKPVRCASLVLPVVAAVLLGPLVAGQSLVGATGPTQPGAPDSAQSAGQDWPAFRFDAAHLGMTKESLINASNASTLVAGWTASAGAGRDTSPAVATVTSIGLTVFVGDSAGVLHAYNASDGVQTWSFTVGGTAPAIYTSATVFGGIVYFASSTGMLYALNAATGGPVCSFNTGKRIQSSPTVVPDTDGSGPVVYIGTESGGGEWAIYGAHNTHGQCTEDWYFKQFTVTPAGTWSSAAYGTDGSGEHLVVFGSKDDDDSVYALDAATGAKVWRYQTSDLSEQDVGSAPLVSAPGVNGIADGAAYVEGKDGVVYALDLTNGSLLWSFNAAKPGLNASSASLVGHSLIIGSAAGLYSLNAVTGAQLWHALSSVAVDSSPAVSGGSGQRVVFVGGQSRNLYALNVATGGVLWTGTTTSGFYGSPAVSHGELYDIDLGGVLHSYTT
jgi:outer membrane protein assembly factor BamB